MVSISGANDSGLEIGCPSGATDPVTGLATDALVGSFVPDVALGSRTGPTAGRIGSSISDGANGSSLEIG